MAVTELKWWKGGNDVQWQADELPVTKCFATAVRNAVPLEDGSGVALVLEAPAGTLDAALILEADGTERARIRVPSDSPEPTYLDQIYYVLHELTLFTNVRGYDWAHVIDERSGKIARSYESR